MLIEVVNLSLDRPASPPQALVDLFGGLLVALLEVVVQGLRVLRAEETLGADEVFDHAVQVSLATSDLVGTKDLIKFRNDYQTVSDI